MREVGGLALLNLAFLSGGYGVLRLLGRTFALADAGLAFCVGVAVLGVTASISAVAGHVPGTWTFLAFAAVVTTPVVLAAHRPVLRPARLRSLPRPHWPGARFSLELAATAALATAAVVYALATLAVASVKFLDEWDAWSMWTLKAKGLVVFGNLVTADFAGAAHPDYPILVPMFQSLVFRFVGSFNTQIVHVEHALLWIAFSGAITRILHGRLRPSALAALALAVLAAPGLARNVPDALADVPVAIFISLAALALGLWLIERRPSWLALFVIFAAGATWTKDEGAAFVAAMCIVAVPLAVGRPRARSVAPLLVAVPAVVLLFLPWELWKRAHHATYETNLTSGLTFSMPASRRHAAAEAVRSMWAQFGDLHLWLAVPYLVAFVAVAAFLLRRGRRLSIFAVLVPTLSFFVYVWVYSIRSDPLGLRWELDTTVTRITSSIGLTAVALLALALTVIGQPGSAAPAVAPEATSGT